MSPVMAQHSLDPRIAVLLVLGVVLVIWPGPERRGGPAPVFRVTADGTVQRAASGKMAPELPPRVALFFDRPFRINRAARADLTMLPGIGPRLADRILSHRATHGPITSPADLLQINGIGPDRVARLAPVLSFR